VAAKLSEHGGRLTLRGLTCVDDAVLTALFNRGVLPELSADMDRTLFTRGSEALVTQYCITNGGELGTLKSLTTRECNPAAAQGMVHADLDLSFDEIQEIAPEIASILANTPHGISVGHLVSLSEKSALALRGHSGPLTIGAITALSLGAARALAEHNGPVTVEDTDDLPEDVAAVLGRNSESGDSEKSCVERACELLNMVQGLASYHPADLLRDVDFKELAAAAETAMQELRKHERQNSSAVEQACGFLEQVQGWGELDLAEFRDVDFCQVAASAVNIASGLLRPHLDGADTLAEMVTPERVKPVNNDWIQSDYQTCEDLLVQGESRDDYIKSHISRLGLWKQAAEAGDPRGQLLYGLCFFYGHGEEESEATAFEWFKKSADQGDINAQYTLGMCYRNGWGVIPNEKASTRWLRKAAAQGYRAAVEVLTTAVARGFLADASSTALHEFTEIEDEAAELLSRYEGTLDLIGLYGLSDAAAESLGKHSGTLNLQNVGELSSAAARSLAQHRGDLDLSGLETLCGVEMSIFRNLNSLAPFRFFESFTPEMEALYREAKQKSEDDLSNLRLYCHNPSYGRSSHEAFFNFWDTLSKCRKLPLWVMYEEENESWNFFEGTYNDLVSRMKRICGYAMDNVGASQDEGEHAANDGECGNIKEEQVAKGKPLTREDAERFVADPESVTLSTYTSVEDDAASLLCEHNGDLELDGVTSLNLSTARILAQFEGETLSLCGLSEIPRDAAEILSSAMASLQLDFSELAPDIQEVLRRHPSFRIDDSRLAFWLREKCGFEDGNEGQAWISEELCEALCEAADKYTCRDLDSDQGWLMVDCYNPFDEGVQIIRKAGNKEIHFVELLDERRHYLVFIGRFDKVCDRLEALIAEQS